MQGIHAHADTGTRAPKRTATSAAPDAIFYPVFMPNCGPALRRRGVCDHVTHAPCAPGIPPVRAPVNPLRHIRRRRKCLPPRSWKASRSSPRHRGGYPTASLTISRPDFPQRHAVKLIPRLDVNHALPLAFAAIQRHTRRRSLRVQPHELPGPAHRARDKHAGRRGLA